ncbi:MAG: transcriptional repressor [Pseudomonadota bacterium]
MGMHARTLAQPEKLKAQQVSTVVTAPNGTPAQTPAPTGAFSRNERLVLETLVTTKAALKAYELLDRLHDEGIKAPMTVYRALDRLAARGLVRKISNLNAFVAVDQAPRQGPSAFLICRECHKVRQIDVPKDQVNSLFALTDLNDEEIFLEAFADCRTMTAPQ